jgi:large subunit ribosomal protein L21
MNIAIALVTGLLIGWLAEWVVDWLYWRGRYAIQGQAIQEQEQTLQVARAAEAEAREHAAKMEERARAAEAVSFSAPVSLEPPTIANRPDDLTKIKGIGPVIAKKLNDAGIMTFQQLSRLSTEEFEQIMGDLLQRFVNEKSILGQARELAEKQRG